MYMVSLENSKFANRRTSGMHEHASTWCVACGWSWLKSASYPMPLTREARLHPRDTQVLRECEVNYFGRQRELPIPRGPFSTLVLGTPPAVCPLQQSLILQRILERSIVASTRVNCCLWHQRSGFCCSCTNILPDTEYLVHKLLFKKNKHCNGNTSKQFHQQVGPLRY
jgi:hypothetical protein